MSNSSTFETFKVEPKIGPSFTFLPCELLVLARTTAGFAFKVGHFLIILSLHSLLATFQVYFSLIFDLFLKSSFWMKQIQGSVRVNFNEKLHAWSVFLFVSILVIFSFFSQIDHFYCFTSLHGLQDVVNHYGAHLRDIQWKTGRKMYLLCHELLSK